MKKAFFVFILAVCMLAVSGCSQAKPATATDLQSGIYDGGLDSITLDTSQQGFDHFFPDQWSSYWAKGSYTCKDGKLYATASGGECDGQQYVFQIIDDLTLAFIESESAPTDITDGRIFRYYYENARVFSPAARPEGITQADFLFIRSPEELASYIAALGKDDDLLAQLESYDTAFFQEQMLAVFYQDAPSYPTTLTVRRIDASDTTITVTLAKEVPGNAKEQLQQSTILLELPQNDKLTQICFTETEDNLSYYP